MTDTEPRHADTLHPLFPTFVGESWFPPHAEEKRALLDRIYAIRDADRVGQERCRAQYHAGYTSYFSLRELYRDPAFASLVAFLGEKAAKYARFQKWDLEHFALGMTSLWINVNPTHSYHPDHVHPYCHISGVFYVSCTPDSGDIVFQDPRPGRGMVPPPTSSTGMENALVWRIHPEEGKAVMFPAWLVHGVHHNPTPHDRVSMSYNFELRPLPPG